MVDPSAFQITAEELHSTLWRRLDDLTKAMIESNRRRNDGETLSIEQTSVIRGRISELKRLRTLLAMDDPSPALTLHGASPARTGE